MTADRLERSLTTTKGGKTTPTSTTPPLTTTTVNKNRLAALNYKPLPFTNPYPAYQTGIGGLAATVSGNLQTDLARVNSSFENIKNQIMAQYGNTNNQALLNARDLALAELGRQADDATRQVAANYQAAQGRQAEFANRQLALADAAAREQEALTNVAAGNIGAWNQQFGVTDGSSVDLASALAAQAPRDAALARALGASAAGFENAMGTSIGEQQMALQGQIARDLASRSGVVSVQTARDIAAAEMADRERLNTALLDAAYRQLSAEEALRGTAGDRSFALEQAMLDAGLKGGLFSNDQFRFEDDRKFRYNQAGLDEQARRDSLAASAARAAADDAWRKEVFDYEAGQDTIANNRAEAALAEERRQFDAKNNATGASGVYTPPKGYGAALTMMVGSSKNKTVAADRDSMSAIASIVQPGSAGTLSKESYTSGYAIWQTLTKETKEELKKTQGIKNYDDLVRSLQRS